MCASKIWFIKVIIPVFFKYQVLKCRKTLRDIYATKASKVNIGNKRQMKNQTIFTGCFLFQISFIIPSLVE